MIIGRQLVNEYYEDEKLYSTGDDELDEMLEKAFCEGYEYAQKEYSKLGTFIGQKRTQFARNNAARKIKTARTNLGKMSSASSQYANQQQANILASGGSEVSKNKRLEDLFGLRKKMTGEISGYKNDLRNIASAANQTLPKNQPISGSDFRKFNQYFKGDQAPGYMTKNYDPSKYINKLPNF